MRREGELSRKRDIVLPSDGRCPFYRGWHPHYVLSHLAGILTTVRFRALKISTVHPSPSDHTSVRRPGY
ncbi:hypothetical protein CKAN_02394800 [Cinnamomum micranthum f. kanehirae]|uniref:Uncharacterized protein n=1 Tax=Cinnamomum micranthum f. kanehirae TaxID=337451 RepID=A0A3S3PNM8_9MAGN|nr:hypothetical protein CKAN_02394800 [Cinnamomum micranthum f. kanehirae]